MKGETDLEIKVPAELKGMATFMTLAINYIKTDRKAVEIVKKKNLSFKLVIESPDFPNPALMTFKNGDILVTPLDQKETAEGKRNWDIKLTAKAPVFLDFFLGRIGTIRPFLSGKIKASPLINFVKMLKLLWFIKVAVTYFKGNPVLSDATFWRYYNYPNPI